MTGGACERCGGRVDGRYCPTCGRDQRPTEPVTSRNDAAVAVDTEQRWRSGGGTPVSAYEADDTKTCPRCAETVKAAAQVCRFCNHEFDGGATALRAEAATLSAPAPATSGGDSDGQTARLVRGGLAAAAVIAVILWFSGALDKPLSSMGLNKEACVQNAFGATFCGEDAERVCREFGGEGCRDAGLSTEGSLEEEFDQLDEELDQLDAELGGS
jgi:RNA polymerase subunit RPABC4/transcription elongation factor Spt4